MKSTSTLLNITIVISCLGLVASYFLPVESEWAPVDAWLGYYSHSSGQFVKGFNIGLIEVFPFAVGLVILFALAFLRWPAIGVCAAMAFATTWVISLVLEVSRISGGGYYRFRVPWVTLAVLIVPLVLAVLVLVLWKLRNRGRILVLTLAAILAACSMLQQSCSIAWYLLEDGLLLNIGCVTGTAAAAVLFVCLLLRRQLLACGAPLGQPFVQGASTSGTDTNSEGQGRKTNRRVILGILLVAGLIAGVIVHAVISYIGPADIHTAVNRGDLEKVKSILAQRPEEINAKDDSGSKPLHLAIVLGDEKLVQFLLAKGAGVNAKDNFGSTPLHLAAEWGHETIANFLIANGADLHTKDDLGLTPLHSAILGGLKGTVELLVAKGADVHVRSHLEDADFMSVSLLKAACKGFTPLHAAVFCSDESIAEFLITQGADLNAMTGAMTGLGYSPLHIAVCRDDRKMAELLLAKGAAINTKSRYGATPLDLAVRFRRRVMVELLLAEGADVNVKNINGESPLDVALRFDRREIAELLRKYGAVE